MKHRDIINRGGDARRKEAQRFNEAIDRMDLPKDVKYNLDMTGVDDTYMMYGTLQDYEDIDLEKELAKAVRETYIDAEYEDPEGEWRVTEVDDEQAYVINVQAGNPNEGKEMAIPFEELHYYMTGGER